MLNKQQIQATQRMMKIDALQAQFLNEMNHVDMTKATATPAIIGAISTIKQSEHSVKDELELSLGAAEAVGLLSATDFPEFHKSFSALNKKNYTQSPAAH